VVHVLRLGYHDGFCLLVGCLAGVVLASEFDFAETNWTYLESICGRRYTRCDCSSLGDRRSHGVSSMTKRYCRYSRSSEQDSAQGGRNEKHCVDGGSSWI